MTHSRFSHKTDNPIKTHPTALWHNNILFMYLLISVSRFIHLAFPGIKRDSAQFFGFCIQTQKLFLLPFSGYFGCKIYNRTDGLLGNCIMEDRRRRRFQLKRGFYLREKTRARSRLLKIQGKTLKILVDWRTFTRSVSSDFEIKLSAKFFSVSGVVLYLNVF